MDIEGVTLAAGSRGRLQGKRVLVVDDNAINQELAVVLLGRVGISASVAGNGEQAIAILEGAEPFELVLMDCQMPVMDGFETTRILRADPRWSALPVVAMTASAVPGDRERAYAAGMNDDVPKPVDLDRFYAVLLRWLLRA